MYSKQPQRRNSACRLGCYFVKYSIQVYSQRSSSHSSRESIMKGYEILGDGIRHPKEWLSKEKKPHWEKDGK